MIPPRSSVAPALAPDVDATAGMSDEQSRTSLDEANGTGIGPLHGCHDREREGDSVGKPRRPSDEAIQGKPTGRPGDPASF